ncbi:hypothetical protein GC197_09335 [bacterium]|nr:hypothetical protein [bacterium]
MHAFIRPLLLPGLLLFLFTAGARSEEPAKSDRWFDGDLKAAFDSAVPKPEPTVIHWRTELQPAYQEALKIGKPIVMVYLCPVDRDSCVFCKRMRGSIYAPETQKYSDDAIFVLVTVNVDGSIPDKAAALVAEKLEIKSRPVISILEPDPAMLRERGRIVGYYSAKELDANLNKLLRQPN